MSGCAKLPSPQLQDANRRLLAIRAKALAHRQCFGDPCSEEREQHSVQSLVGESAPNADCHALPADLPDHLGWGSEVLTAVLRQAAGNATHYNKKSAIAMTGETAIFSNPQPSIPNPNDTIKLFPDIALGMLRAEQAAPGRIWLLLRYLDQVGQGWLRVVKIRKTFTHKQSPIRVCGWRQLRNLLRQGDGIFWTRDKTQIWLKSAANVAAALGVERLTGKPVAVPVRVLTGSIGEVRAHLYAGFHSGRSKEDRRQPIARETLVELTGVGRRTQLAYEAVTGLSVQHNYAIGERFSPETAEKHAWHQGQATFVLQDSHGAQGKPGRSYIAWQLPNSYGGCHAHAPRGRQRRINRKLTDLMSTGASGNSSERLDTRYYPDGKQAVNMASRHPEWNVYWWRQQT
ncbi:MAG: hypothetical protein DWQ04_11795, partial [Chloroflexi bacterium]